MAVAENFVNPEDRRNKSNEKIKKMGIACLETLPVIKDSTSVSLKTTDEICKRAIVAVLSIQLACDIAGENDYDRLSSQVQQEIKSSERTS